MQQLSHAELVDIAKQFGTPVYVYHSERIAEQYERITKAFKEMDTRFFYACKALTNINILRFIQRLGSSVDCSSINEVKLCLYAGFASEDILYTSNGIDFNEIKEARELGVHINVDSLTNLEKFGREYGHEYPVGIRLRPDIMAGGNLKISTGHDKSKFGIPVYQADIVLSLVKQYNMHIKTLHIHTGSEILDVDVFIRGIEVLFDWVPEFRELESVDLGGGFKVPYKDGDGETDINLLAQKLSEAFKAHPAQAGRKLQVWFEPGKFLVSAAGFLITQVNLIKETGSATFICVNSGFNHLVRPMMYDAYHHIENITNPDGELKTYSVVGNICETDTFAWERQLPVTKEGDLIVFHNAGAYGFEMSSQFNSRLRPSEVISINGQSKLIRKREVFADLLTKQVI